MNVSYSSFTLSMFLIDFGLATITVLTIAALLMLLGIYNSAILVSANNDLRQSIYKYALGSKLLGQIGRAEAEIELEKAVTKATTQLYLQI